MTLEFQLPDVGEGIAEGELVDWSVAEGDTVEEGQVIAEIETDKAVVDVPSPTDGTVLRRKASKGDAISVGEVFVVIDDDDAEVSNSHDNSTEPVDNDPDVEQSSNTSGSGPEADPSESPASTNSQSIFAPPSVRRLARELGVSIAEVEGTGVSGRVTGGDVYAHTENTGSTSSGKQHQESNKDDTEGSDGSISHITSDTSPSGDEGVHKATIASEAGANHLQSSQVVEERDVTLATPEVRRMARERDINLDVVPSSKERDGKAFVTAEDLEAYDQKAQATQSPSDASRDEGDQDEGRTDGVIREPYRGIRKSIGEQMAESKFSAPHVTHFEEVDVTELVEVRNRLLDTANEQEVSLTYLPFILKACIAGLKENPILNASLDEENEEVVKKQSYNIGVATETDAGLMVPVVDDVDQKGIMKLASETNELVEKARNRSISVDEMRGGTFTVSNTGAIGGEFGTPILNPPESGVLAIGSIKKKPRVVTDDDGTESIEPRQIMKLSLSFDHRIVDGADAARFTNTVQEFLEQPELLIL